MNTVDPSSVVTASDVIESDGSLSSIENAFKISESKEFKDCLPSCESPYGNEPASIKIVDALEKFSIYPSITKQTMAGPLEIKSDKRVNTEPGLIIDSSQNIPGTYNTGEASMRIKALWQSGGGAPAITWW